MLIFNWDINNTLPEANYKFEYDRIIHSPIGEKLNGKCEECGSKKYIEWDYESKKCPKCKHGIIGESNGGVHIMAD